MIRVRDLTIHSGPFRLSRVSFEIEDGRYCVLMGKTGCGKTTLLEALCGLRTVTGGSIELAGRDVTHFPPGSRGIGYVPQDGALFLTMTVAANIGFSLEIRGAPQAEITARTVELARLLDIEKILGRMPAGLSGGERQRVALARALAFKPSILLLDEPLSAVDESMREGLCAMLERVHGATPVTVLHVTHSRREAEQLAEILMEMDAGQVRVKGTGRAAATTGAGGERTMPPENSDRQATINITIRYSGQIRGIFGMASERQAVASGISAQEFILQRANAAGEKAHAFLNGSIEHRSAATLIFINGTQAAWHAPQPLKDGDEILLLSPLAGG